MVLDSGEQWELEEFQAEIVADVFSGVPEVWAIIPEGNAKTTLMAGISLYHADYTPSANCLVAASSRDQAEVLFRQAEGLIYRSPGFESRFKINPGYRRIVSARSHGRVQVMAADDRTGDGAIPSLGILDELHRHRDLKLYRTWRGKLDKRGGQILGISTAGEPGSEFEEARHRMHVSADESVVDGSHVRSASPDHVIHDWRVPADVSPDDMDAVKDANPLAMITPEKLARRRSSPTMTPQHWARFVCNIPSLEGGQWLDDRAGWDGAGKRGRRIEPGATVVLAYDPAYLFDHAALVALEATGDWRGRCEPVEIFKPEARDGGAIPNWRVEQAILAACEKWQVQMVGYDFNRGFVEAAERLSDEHDLPMVRVPMGSGIWAPLTAAMRAAIQSGQFEHPDDPEFTAHVLSGQTKDTPQGPRLHGRVTAKVDALMALGMCCFLTWGTPDDPVSQISIYETRGGLL